jgi:hypothetical protein
MLKLERKGKAMDALITLAQKGSVDRARDDCHFTKGGG